MSDAVTAVQSAAVEGALADAPDARRRFALAGALEVARSDGDAGLPVLSAVGALYAIGRLESVRDAADAWHPDATPLDDCVLAGAAIAVERFDREVETVAAAAGVPAVAVRVAVEEAA